MSGSASSPGAVTLRAVIYVLMVSALALSLRLDLDRPAADGQLFTEYSLLEMTQLALAGVCLLLLALPGLRDREQRPVQVLWMGLVACLLVRETDLWLDHYVFDGAWQVLVSGILVLVAVSSYRDRTELAASVQRFCRSPAFGLFLAGILILVYSRWFGKQDLWRGIMAENYNNSVKNAAEEGVEVLGHMLILIAAIEYVIQRFSQRRRPGAQGGSHETV